MFKGESLLFNEAMIAALNSLTISFCIETSHGKIMLWKITSCQTRIPCLPTKSTILACSNCILFFLVFMFLQCFHHHCGSVYPPALY